MKAWYFKFVEKQKARAKRKKERAELEQSNWGIDFGWFIEYQGNIVGELIHGQFEDMFWYRYELIAYDQQVETLFDFDNWINDQFRLKNKHYPQYVEHWIAGGDQVLQEQNRYFISMRGLQVSFIQSDAKEGLG